MPVLLIMKKLESQNCFKKYEESIETVDNRYHIGLPFKKDDVSMSDNYQYALNRMLKLEQWLKKNDELRINYFEFMGELFGSGHAVAIDQSWKNFVSVSFLRKFQQKVPCCIRLLGEV